MATSWNIPLSPTREELEVSISTKVANRVGRLAGKVAVVVAAASGIARAATHFPHCVLPEAAAPRLADIDAVVQQEWAVLPRCVWPRRAQLWWLWT